MRSVAVLGATGSIGRQALDVIAESPGLRACALSANRDADGLVAAARATGARHVALADADAAGEAARELEGVTVLRGDAGVEELIAASGADLVLNAIVAPPASVRRWPPSRREPTWRSRTRRASWPAGSSC